MPVKLVKLQLIEASKEPIKLICLIAVIIKLSG
jgi:hypothetical protein